MTESTESGFSALRRAQVAAWATLIGLFLSFLALVATESQLPDRVVAVKAVLIAFLLLHLATVAYLRTRRCPACGERFVGSTKSMIGSFTAMTQRTCQHCGGGGG